MKKTNKRHFALFKRECSYWIKLLGLTGWEVEFYHKEDLAGCRASANISLMNRVVSFYLNPEWKSDSVTDDRVCACGKHEALELLFARIAIIGKSRFVNEDEIDEEGHNLVRLFENIL